jgi:hypothetical protein
MKILIMVLSYDDSNIYTKFYETQKKTWDSVSINNVETYYYFGNKNENRIIGKDIHTIVPESLVNCGPKTIESFKLIHNKNFDFVFRTNSSSYVDKELLKIYLENKAKSNFYSGIIGNYFGTPFCSGSGFILSKDLVNILIENEKNLDYNLIDDVCFGKFFSDLGVIPSNSQRFDIIDMTTEIEPNFFHYRLKTHDRINDINNMEKIHNQKILKKI